MFGSKLFYLLTVVFLFFIGPLIVLAERPTRQQVQVYATACINNEQKADFIRKFGTDFSGLDLSGIDFRGPPRGGQKNEFAGSRFLADDPHQHKVRRRGASRSELRWSQPDQRDFYNSVTRQRKSNGCDAHRLAFLSMPLGSNLRSRCRLVG